MKPGESAKSRSLVELTGRLAKLGNRAQQAVRDAREALAVEPPSIQNASVEITEEARKATSAHAGAQVEVAVK